MSPPEVALLAATAAHAGFQTTISVLVYPALARVGEADWVRAHRLHSRGVTPLVAVLYGALVAAAAWVLATGPTPWARVSLGAVLATVLVTATAAAPLHGRLERRDGDLLRRLLVVDRVRCAGGLVALLAAGAAVLTAG